MLSNRRGGYWGREAWVRENVYDLMKIENRSNKLGHLLVEIGVGIIRTFRSFSFDSAYDSSVNYDPLKLD